jgi:hypothetical protein
MSGNHKLFELGEKVWSHRKKFGFTKKLSPELQAEAVEIFLSGSTAYEIGKVLGVPRNTIADWVKRQTEHKTETFNEVQVTSNSIQNYQIKVSGKVHGCFVEIIGTDYSLLQRLLRKLER